ncbi:MAG TPA: hypothetical protein VF584_19160 [Longimicrobium sp.]|jgi:hypothetical protein
MRWKIWLTLGLAIYAPVAAAAQDPAQQAREAAPGGDSTRILVVDLTTAGAEDPHAATYMFKRNASLLQTLENAKSANAEGARQAVIAAAAAAGEEKSTRWPVGAGGVLRVFVFHELRTTARIHFKENARSTRLSADFATLAKLGLAIATAPEALVPEIQLTTASYTLTRRRANLLVTTTLERPAAGAAAAERAKTDSVQTTLVTGGAEHLFLAAHASATDVNQLKFDEASNTLQPRKTPTAFSVAFNYSFGDILTDPADLSGGVVTRLLHGLTVGGTLQASRRPFDQVGATAGLRYNPIPYLNSLLSFETVSPFAGVVWTKDDRVDADGNEAEDRRYGRGNFIWGVSLNLDKALGWVGGGGK